ncbi:MAG: NlpC/P60 family protein [Betaproteobacteria bacterium]|nr:NlpC/P60 family protein [Betaproteobacteria bacterium]
MRKYLLSLSMLFALGAQAAPNNAAHDDIDLLLIQRGVVKAVVDVGQTVGTVGQIVTSQASDLVVNAMGYLGVPYRRGGTGLQGFDCSGFVQSMYENTLGLVLPHNAKAQAAATEKIDKTELQPGDLVFFNTLRRAFSHVGIYIGEGKFIHSPRAGGEVRIEDMRDSYWVKRFNGARRVNSASNEAVSEASLR